MTNQSNNKVNSKKNSIDVNIRFEKIIENLGTFKSDNEGDTRDQLLEKIIVGLKVLNKRSKLKGLQLVS